MTVASFVISRSCALLVLTLAASDENLSGSTKESGGITSVWSLDCHLHIRNIGLLQLQQKGHRDIDNRTETVTNEEGCIGCFEMGNGVDDIEIN